MGAQQRLGYIVKMGSRRHTWPEGPADAVPERSDSPAPPLSWDPPSDGPAPARPVGFRI